MIKSPVKWHGGKSYLAEWIISFFPKHEIYVEPFGGGASVLFAKEPVGVEVYNDLDFRITRLFRMLRLRGKEFIGQVDLIPYSEAEFDLAIAYKSGADPDDMEAAVCDFVRWRQSFGGHGKSFGLGTRRARGGMMGDVNAWLNAIERLPEIVERIQRVEILCRNANNVIEKFDDPNTLFYCDPPYLHETREAHSRDIYAHEMSHLDHMKLLCILKACRAKVILSGYRSGLYDEELKSWRLETKDMPNNSAGGRSKGRETECLWMNF